MDRQKNPRDSPEGQGDRLAKKPRTETGLFGSMSVASAAANSPFVALRSAAKPSPSVFDSPLFGGQGQPKPFPPAPSSGGFMFGKPAVAKHQPGLANTTAVSKTPAPVTSGNGAVPGTPTAPSGYFTSGTTTSGPGSSNRSIFFGAPSTVLQQGAAKATETHPATLGTSTVKEEGMITIKQEAGSEDTAVVAPVKPMSDPITGPIESFDDSGDLILVVGKTKVNFSVCSRSFARPSTPWKARLHGPSAEPKVGEGVHPWVIRLPEDNPEALRIILQATHSRLSDVPKFLTREILFHLTVFYDKYGTVELLKPFWSGWIAKLPKPTLEPTDFVQQVWISHKLGDLKSYKEILLEFLYSAQKRPGYNGRLFLEGHPDVDLYQDPYLQQLGLPESWEIRRMRMMLHIENILRMSLNNLSNPKNTMCRSRSMNPDWRLTCDCAMLGGVHRALYDKSWYSSGMPNWEKQVTISVRQLVTKMEGIRTAAIGESRMRRNQGGAHKTCTPWEPFELADVLRMCPMQNLGPLVEAVFEKQAEKSGLDVPVLYSTVNPFGTGKGRFPL